ncbi:glutaredoxin family protein [Thalassotalea fusca]
MKIVLYSMQNCPHCQTVKKYLLTNNVSFRECNVKTPAGQKEFARTGFRGVPIIKVADSYHQVTNLKSLAKLLKQ